MYDKLFEEAALLADALERAEMIVDCDSKTELVNDLRELARFQKTRGQKIASDHRHRILVGAMIPRGTAARLNNAAKATGRSLYRFTRDALNNEYVRFIVEETTPRGKHERV